MIDFPSVIIDRIQELNELVAKYPYNIPAVAISKFLHIDVNRFRYAALHNGIPFTIQWEEDSKEVKTPTLAFYMWVMGGGKFLPWVEKIV